MNGYFVFIWVVTALCLGIIGIARIIDIFESNRIGMLVRRKEERKHDKK